MKRSYVSAIALAAATLAAGQVMAADQPDQAFAAVREGLRTGHVVANPYNGPVQTQTAVQSASGQAPDQFFAAVRDGVRTGQVASFQTAGQQSHLDAARNAAVQTNAPVLKFDAVREAIRTGNVASVQFGQGKSLI